MNEKECDLSTKTCHVPNLQRHHATCGLNYSLLLRLARRFGSEGSLFILPFGGQDCLVGPLGSWPHGPLRQSV